MRGLLVLLLTLTTGLIGCVTVELDEPMTTYPHAFHTRPAAYALPDREQITQETHPPPVRERRPVRIKPARTATWFPKGRRISPRWTTIVIHHSATEKGGAAVFDRYHKEQNGWDELGYHFVIGNGTGTPDGMIEVGPRWDKQKHGAHCKTAGNYYNEHGIGICLVGDFTRSLPTPRQLDSLNRLVRFLMDETGIPAKRVTTHRAITGKTECPGRYFSLASLRRSVSAPATATSLP